MPRASILILALFLAGCLTAQTRIELQKARQDVAQLQVQVRSAELSQAANLNYLREQLGLAQAKLAKVEEKADLERTETTAATVEQGANALGPLLGTFLPGAAIALGAVGATAGAIRRKAASKRKKEGA